MLAAAVTDRATIDEISFLREQITSFRATLSTFEARLKVLESRVAGREDADSTIDEKDQAVIESGNEPAFLKEIYLMIGSYLTPGSRALLNLASTCRKLYRLLLPRLLERIDSKLILLDPRFYSWRETNLAWLGLYVREISFPSVAVPGGHQHVSIDSGTAARVLQACSGRLKRLMIDMEGMVNGTEFWDNVFYSLGRWSCGMLHPI